VWADLVLGKGLEPVCPEESQDPGHLVCDHFTLTVKVPASYWRAHHGGVKVSVAWPDPGNKILIAAFKNGKYLSSGWGGDPASLVLPDANGTYDIEVDPELVTHPTSYSGAARIIELPRTPAVPSLGGPAAYRATRIASPDPDRPPANERVPYRGPPVELVAHPVHKETFEPTLGVDRKGAVFINGQSTEETPVIGERHPPHVFRSTDHGRSWQNAGTTDADTWHFTTQDPMLYVDPDYGRVFRLDLFELSSSTLSFTDDQGRSWTNTMVTTVGINDHPTIVTGAVPDGSGLATLDPAFPKIVYYCVNQVTYNACARSLDGGVTFHRAGSPILDQSTSCPGNSLMDHLTTDREGRVFLGASNCAIPGVSSSSDGGMTWTNSVVTTKIHSSGHDVATAEDAAGNVYALWNDDQQSLPYLSVSRDHGRKWSTPLMVAPPGVHETAMLTLTAGSRGRIAVGMVATTVDNAGDNGRPWSYYVTVTQNALDRRPLFVSNVAPLADTHTRIVNRGPCCAGMADFLDLKTAPVRGGPVWGSLAVVCTGTCVTKRNASSNLENRGLLYAVEQTGGPALVAPASRLP
jgi:hypothetical protein